MFAPTGPWEFPTACAKQGVSRIHGRIKQTCADFVVEEIPAYQPCGEGEHLFLWIEKEDVSAEYLVRRIAKATGVNKADIGVAGMKDRTAITRQFVSIPASFEEAADAIHSDDIRVLSKTRHMNKLRTGHLQGNKFEIRIADVSSDPETLLEPLLELIGRDGFPNYFGEQRFGIEGETARLGFELLRGEKKPRDIPHSRRKFLLRLALSAAQSWMFNAVVAQRINVGMLRIVQAGDVMEVIESGGKFLAEDPAQEQPRCDQWETAITGPLFGPKMKQPEQQPAAIEKEVLQSQQIPATAFEEYRKLTAGARRAVVCRPSNIKAECEVNSIRLSFALPPGVYATSLLREVMEN